MLELHKNYTIGFSGFVYKSGRKGEALAAKLAKDASFENCKFIASGRGWPIKTINYKFEDLHKFFKSLDVYVCTSTIEGIGYPVIEAMACGIPIVIPKGVGIFDELPDLENIHRYNAGDYSSLKNALLKSLETIENGGINRLSLNGAAQKFTKKVWVQDHNIAFEELLYGSEYIEPSNGNAGIYYVAYGRQAIECVTRAIRSAKKFLPQIPVCLVTDSEIDLGQDITVLYPDNDIGARKAKILVNELAPKEWEYILYLDADTEIVSSDVTFLFDLLKTGFEFAACINPAQYVLVKEMARSDNKDEMQETIEQLGTDNLIQLNGGVFSFRRNKNTKLFFEDWLKEWDKYGKRDQAALDRALYKRPLRICTLGNEWNTITRYIPAESSAGILHYPMTARRWAGRIDGRLDSKEAWAKVKE